MSKGAKRMMVAMASYRSQANKRGANSRIMSRGEAGAERCEQCQSRPVSQRPAPSRLGLCLRCYKNRG